MPTCEVEAGRGQNTQLEPHQCLNLLQLPATRVLSCLAHNEDPSPRKIPKNYSQVAQNSDQHIAVEFRGFGARRWVHSRHRRCYHRRRPSRCPSLSRKGKKFPIAGAVGRRDVQWGGDQGAGRRDPGGWQEIGLCLIWSLYLRGGSQVKPYSLYIY